jgi:hypothetical protein
MVYIVSSLNNLNEKTIDPDNGISANIGDNKD